MSADRSRRDVLAAGLGAIGAATLSGCASGPVVVRGAGATAQVGTYLRWFRAFEAERSDVRLDYLPVASGGGLRQLALGAVDFAVSDVDLLGDDAGMDRLYLSLPTGLGATAIAYHLPGVDPRAPLHLPRVVLACILRGEITRWRDPELLRANPSRELPDLPIAVVTRSDGGGSTAIVTRALAAADPIFAARVGAGRAVAFDVGVGRRGSEGVLRTVCAIAGAIGYVEAGRAERAGLGVATLDDEHGAPVGPTAQAVARWGDSLGVEGGRVVARAAAGYPLSSLGSLVVRLDAGDRAIGAALASFAWFVLTSGQRALEVDEGVAAGLLPLPRALAARSLELVRTLRSGELALAGID
jgi:phosphate transport system substrate-binding protein